jgi:O-antigen ligase
LLAVNLAWTTLANGGYGARIELVTLWLTAALLAVHGLALGWGGGPRRAPHPAGLLLLPFLGYALANVLWVTPVPWLGWRDWLGWAQLIAVFWVVLNGIRARGPRWTLFYTLVALGIAGVVMGCYQRFVQPDWRMVGPARDVAFLGRASGSFSIPNSFAGFLLLLIPAVIALTLRRSATATERVWWGWVGVVLGLGFVLTLSRGAWLCLALALPVWTLVAVRGGWRRRAALAFGVFVVLVSIGVVVVSKYPAARERFAQLAMDSGERTRPIVWRAAWRLFQEAPVVGTGAGSYNIVFERHRPERFRDEPLWAHNEYLNTLSDYGLLGFSLFFGAAGVLALLGLWRSVPSSRLQGSFSESFVLAGLGAGVLAFSLQLLLDFHLKIPGLAAAFAVVAALIVAGVWPRASDPDRKRPAERLLGLGFCALSAVGVVWFHPILRGEAERREGRTLIDELARVEVGHPDYSKKLPLARARLGQATVLDPTNAQAWSDLSYATALYAFIDPAQSFQLGRDSELAADRALRIAPACSEFWLRRGVARDMQGRWAEAGADFAVAVERAPADATTWSYYADHFFRRAFTKEMAEAALEFCLRLDPWNPAGLALRQRLAIRTKSP